ncbi:S8 family serine peptidase [Jatrophihabitans sp.]|uniref:S8 family serine peptidase n=1 Tax=Jatrophihabitans sp. TaxID=1932789 RepID=UPI002BE681C8|nr:S8 family serine peptidase [Jatrophihabitans sp.]
MNPHHSSAVSPRWDVLSAVGATVAALCLAAGGPAPIASGTAPAAHSWHLASLDFSGGKWGDPTADSVSKDSYGKNAAEKDPGSLFTITKATQARALWGKKDKLGRPVTGQGVGVAVIDSGISQVAGLDAPGKVTYGPDLSIEDNGSLANQDTFGHGTFMAGIIAGRGAGNPSSDLASAPANIQLGVAPDAKLLAMKVATTDGSADVSQVIAALDWVTQHPVLPDGTRVRVINLSYGTDSTQDYRNDPLAAAAENAWQHGIVVVTSVGNDGAVGRVTTPASDPYLLAVGAADSGDRLDGWAHDHTKPASYSNVGSASRHADVLVPGTSLVSLRSAGSYIDVTHPEGLVSGDVSGRLFRGSGTSQAAAVLSGAVADLLQAYPNLTPDQVKYVLTSTAETVKDASVNAAGEGTIRLGAAFDAANKLLGTDGTAATMRAAAVQAFPRSTGQGSLDAARGGSVLVDADGNDLTGEIDVQGNAWDAAAWWNAASTLTSWSGGQWLGTTWTGDDWSTDTGLSSARWSSARWSSARWSSADWSSARWSSARWSSARWSSARWSSARWSSNDW